MKLAKQQNQMINAIFSLTSEVTNSDKALSQVDMNQQGLAIYQNNLRANGRRALAITFKTVAELLGDSCFTELCDNYFKQCLKTEYDWGELGHDFADFIQQQPWLPITPECLCELAQLDFMCHHAERAADKPANLASLGLLNEIDAYQLSFDLAAGFSLLTSHYPLTNIQQQLAENNHKTIELMESPVNNTNHYFVIWRPHFKVQCLAIEYDHYLWLEQLLRQQSIGQALDGINHSNFSFTDWLPDAIQQQQICALKRQ